MADIIMPKMGDAMEEGKIVQWLKKVGDDVKAGEAIAEIETDKSNVEIEAEAGGTLQSIAVQAGEIAPVGATIAVVGSGAAVAAAPVAATPQPEPEAAPVAPAEPAPKPETNGTGPAAPVAAPVATPPVAVAPAVASGPVSISRPVNFKPYDSFVGSLPEGLGGSASTIGEPIVVSGGATSGAERVRATPLARAMAQSHNLDLAGLRGTGPDGGIVKADVESAIAGGGATAAAPVSAPAAPTAPAPTAQSAASVSDGDEVQEYNAMRRTIAKRLSESKSTIPHFYVTAEIDVEALFVLREQVNAGGAEGVAKVSLNDFLVKAVAVALAENPVINSSFSDNKRILRKAINIGIAVSIDDGLIVPVVKGCESKSLRAISKETRPLIEKAREGKLKPDQYTGGTFTISNLGQYDVENFAAIINPGEGAILAVSSIRPVAAVVDGQVVPRKRMNVTLCADHRVMDGVAGAMFLQSLKRAVENPLQILA